MRYIVLTLFLGFCGFLFARNDLGKQRLIVTTDLGAPAAQHGRSRPRTPTAAGIPGESGTWKRR